MMTNNNNNNRFTELAGHTLKQRKRHAPHHRLSIAVRRQVRSDGCTTGPRSQGPRIPTNKCASRSLSERHKALPYSAPLPLRSDIAGTAETLAATRDGSKTLGPRRGTRRVRLRRSPEAPELFSTQQNRPSFQHHGQFPLHCLLSEPRRIAASRPGRDRQPGSPGLRAAAPPHPLQLRGAAGGQGAQGDVPKHSWRLQAGARSNSNERTFNNYKEYLKTLIQSAARQPIRARLSNHMSEFRQ